MCTVRSIDVNYAIAADTISSTHSGLQPGDSHARPEIRPIDPEAIVTELVKQYLHCSTTISGIFRCW